MKNRIGFFLQNLNSFNIGSNRFQEFKFSWNYVYILLPLATFISIVFITFQIDYSFIYELDNNLYTSGSVYLLMWNYSFGDYQYPGKFTFNDFKNYMMSNFILISSLIFLIIGFAFLLVIYSLMKSKSPSNTKSFEIDNSFSSLRIKILGGFGIVFISSFFMWYYVFDATLQATSLNNYIDYTASTPAEAISLSDYNSFLNVYDFYSSVAMYAIVYAVIVLIGFLTITYFSHTIINRSKGKVLLQEGFILLPEFTISKSSTGIKQNIKNWKKIPIHTIKDINNGYSTEYYTGSKVISSYWIGNTHYTQSQESSYSKSVKWIIIETMEEGNYAIPIVSSQLPKKTINNESVGKIFLERFNHIGFSTQSVKDFLFECKKYFEKYDLQKKIELIAQVNDEENMRLKV